MAKIGIEGYVCIRNNTIISDGHVLFEKQNVSAHDFFNSAYAEFRINYPKFFKMDSLCKTGFLAVEILMQRTKNVTDLGPMETGILFCTANSSLESDLLYQESTLTIASPSLFVYTLPNILVGELCIRHQIKGDSACFIFDTFNASFQADYLNALFNSGKIKAGISGWADFYNDKFEAFFYKVGINAVETSKSHIGENIDKFYNHP